jgi:hypothetical protein
MYIGLRLIIIGLGLLEPTLGLASRDDEKIYGQAQAQEAY